MQGHVQFYISMGIAGFCLLTRWFALNFIATRQTDDWLTKVYKCPVPKCDFFRIFRSLGFDLANASVGLMAIAYVLESSNFYKKFEQSINFQYLLAGFCFVALLLFYISAVKIRYSFLEAAENKNDIDRSWKFGFLGVVLGIIMLFISSFCAV